MSQQSIEWWDGETISDESRAFTQRQGTFVGLLENELRQRLGEPDRKLGGSGMGTNVTLQADYNLHYHSVLPHTVVGFAILNGAVRGVYFLPKVKDCSPEQQRVWGKLVAPT